MLASFALTATVTACGSMSMPSVEGLGRMGAAALPIGPAKEQEIGFGIAATVAGRYGLVEDPALNQYVSLVGSAVAEQSLRAGEVEFHFGILDTDDVNAFATPGGYIFITRGALALMESEAELAGVLAHEVAHVDEKHVLDDIRRAGVMSSASDEAQLSGPLLDAVSEAGASLLFTGLSREDEMQADSLGLIYARAVGYRPDGMLQFLAHLDAAVEEEEGGLREWVATHPPTTERADKLRADMAAAGIRPDAGVDGERRFRARARR
ncbi:MAG TPA: M48 family metalloprotease [Longimicrobiales bacterium]|nr:M48 family metalloprotease [Longimicrobiales bacterium]